MSPGPPGETSCRNKIICILVKNITFKWINSFWYLDLKEGVQDAYLAFPFGHPFTLLIVAVIHLFWSLRAWVEEQELSSRVSAGEGLGDPDWLCSHPLPSTSTLPIKILSLQNFLSYPFIGTLMIMYSIPPVSWSQIRFVLVIWTDVVPSAYHLGSLCQDPPAFVFIGSDHSFSLSPKKKRKKKSYCFFVHYIIPISLPSPSLKFLLSWFLLLFSHTQPGHSFLHLIFSEILQHGLFRKQSLVHYCVCMFMFDFVFSVSVF